MCSMLRIVSHRYVIYGQEKDRIRFIFSHIIDARERNEILKDGTQTRFIVESRGEMVRDRIGKAPDLNEVD